MEQVLQQTAYITGRLLSARGLRMATAESCTGGGVAHALTSIAGSSQWFECGFVTYSNESKQQMLGVAEPLILEHGAVSDAVVQQMSRGAVENSQADVAVAISGIAGPDGGSTEKPVGTVWFSWYIAPDNEWWSECCHFEGDRASVREQAVLYALEGLNEQLEGIGFET